jgi:hypothetical protein
MDYHNIPCFLIAIFMSIPYFQENSMSIPYFQENSEHPMTILMG